MNRSLEIEIFYWIKYYMIRNFWYVSIFQRAAHAKIDFFYYSRRGAKRRAGKFDLFFFGAAGENFFA